MEQVETLTHTASDGYEFAVRRFAPPAASAPRGAVVYLHGIQSHGGWYEASAAHLAASGLAVWLPDRRGSGLNKPQRGHASQWERLAADVTELEDRALAEASDAAGRRVPLVLVAVSWGGKLAAALAAMHGDRYAGMALLCPGICPRQDVSLAEKCRIAWALARGRDTERFPIPLADPRLFTATPEWIEFLERDPLALHEATARFLVESRRLDAFVRESAPWIRVPALLMLAGRDRIIDNRATLAWWHGIGSRDATVRHYGDAHHTLEFEPDPAGVFDDLRAWVVQCCDTRT